MCVLSKLARRTNDLLQKRLRFSFQCCYLRHGPWQWMPLHSHCVSKFGFNYETHHLSQTWSLEQLSIAISSFGLLFYQNHITSFSNCIFLVQILMNVRSLSIPVCKESCNIGSYECVKRGQKRLLLGALLTRQVHS